MHILTYTTYQDDILHARIQTMGVAEHIFDVDLHGKSVTWHLFDVGGARGQRHSWVLPLIALIVHGLKFWPIRFRTSTRPTPSSSLLLSAPLTKCVLCGSISAPLLTCVQYLEEDPRTNRIDDSLQLFTQVCSNALLKSVHLVLFLSAYLHPHLSLYPINTVRPQTKPISSNPRLIMD